MTLWQAALLGLIQGLAEFLPISSSGHLVLGTHLLGLETTEDITFEVFVHFGTTLSILTVYWQRVWRVVAAFFRGILELASLRVALSPGSVEEGRGGRSAPLRLALYVLVTMIPTGLVYVFFKDTLEAAFENPRLVCGALIVTGVLLLLTRIRPYPNGVLSPVKAFVVGIAQSMAMIPGISRSGATICTAIYQNVDRKEAADFSFLMLLPVVFGATLLKTIEMVQAGGGSVGPWPLFVGTVIAYLSGIVAIRAVVILVQRRSLQYFAFYCFLVGGLGLVFL